ncbi:MAG: FkbM family methyltransferase [Anaerolineales bacterium]|nr:FkbM family methyltransferase [Anaerolineales bacterium]
MRLKSFFFLVFNAAKMTLTAKQIIVNPFNTFIFFLRSALNVKSAFCMFRFQGISFYSRGLDWFGVEEVLLNGEYDEVLVELKSLVDPVVLDLGANIGAFSIRAFAYNPRCTIYSVEPGWKTCEVLRKNQLENPSFKWNIFQVAVWNRSGFVGFNDNLDASTSSKILPDNQESKVPVVRLADLIKGHIGLPIDIVKIDVEGVEEDILFDSVEALSLMKTLIVEIHPARCNENKVRVLLKENFLNVREVNGRRSSKPLLVCTN